MNIECMFGPCVDCETYKHCPLYWKAKAYELAKALNYSMAERERLNELLDDLKSDNLTLINLLKGFKLQGGNSNDTPEMLR
jgi:hypothetical protein